MADQNWWEQAPLASTDDDKWWEAAPLADAPKAAPASAKKSGGFTEFATDVLKRAGGAAISGIASIPEGIQSAARATIRNVASGDPSAIMPSSVYMPGIDTDEAINGPMTQKERAQRELEGERMAGAVQIPGAATAAKWGKGTQQAINDTASQVTKDAVANSQITGNLLKGEINFGKDPSVRGFLMQGADVFGSMLPVVATALATRSPAAGAAVGGSMAAGEGVGNARDFIAKQTDADLVKNSPLFARMIDGGASPVESRKIVSARAEDTAGVLQGLVASLGDHFTGKLVTGAFDPLIAKLAGKTMAGKVAAGTALSALEEGSQEFTEGLASDVGTKSVVQNKEIGEDSAANFVLGALGGGAPGAARGAVAGVKARGGPGAAKTGEVIADPQAGSAASVLPVQTSDVAGQQSAVQVGEQAAASAPDIQRAEQASEVPGGAGGSAAVITRLAELEVIGSATGLTPEQQAERDSLAQQVEVQAAREAELEAVGEAVQSQASAINTEQTAEQTAAATKAQANEDVREEKGFDPAAIQAKTFPQFTQERGFKHSALRSGSAEWNQLLSEWDSLKTYRAGVNPEGTGSIGAPTPEIQNRDRTRPASVVQMQGMAQKPDYMRLGVSRTPESGAPMAFANGDQVQAAHALGREDTAVMSDGQRVPFRYAVMEAADVQPSNFADGNANPMFDSDHPGVVKALNNGRTAGLRAAYERGTAEDYKRELMADSEHHGIDPEVIAGMKAPMLVRMYSEADNRTNMGAKSQSQALGLSAAEQAATDSSLVDGGVLEMFDSGALDSAGNADFARGFIGKLQAEGQDVAGMLDAGGALSPAGVTRLQAALVHKAYGDGDLVESMFGSTDNDIRAIGEALKSVAGEWANLRNAAEKGAINPAVDVTGNLLQAVRMVQKARRERASLYDAAQQVDMLTGEVPDPNTIGVLRMLYSGHYLTRALGRDRIADSLRLYMGAALATRADADMFGEQIGPESILAALSGPPTNPQPNVTANPAIEQPTPRAAEGQRVANGGNLAGSGSAESGQQARGQGSDRAGQEATQDGRGGQGQDAKDPSGQPDREVAQGDGKDGSRAVEEAVAEKAPAVNAPAFKRWFGDSKVVDDNGRPLVMFHGTGTDITTFDREGLGTHFTADPSVASEFASGNAEGGNVIPVYLSVSNPLRIKDHGGSHDQATGVAEALIRSDALPAGYINDAFYERLLAGDYEEGNIKELSRIRGILEAQGFDGIIYDNTGEGGGDAIIPFRPSQVKSATGNNGEFSSNDRDIRYSRSPENLSGPTLGNALDAGRSGLSPEQAQQLLRVMGNLAPSAEWQAQEINRVRDIVDPIRKAWVNGPKVEVVYGIDDPRIPESARKSEKEQTKQGAGAAEGFYYQGKVYLIASQLSSPMDVARVLFHEVLGHHGFKGAFGDELKPIMAQIALVRPREVLAKLSEYGLEDTPGNRLVAAEEVLANMAEKNPEMGFVRRAVAAIRTWLRSNMPWLTSMKVADSEIIRNFILPAREWVRSGVENEIVGAGSEVVAFVRHPGFSGAVDAAAKAGQRGEAGARGHIEIGTLPSALLAAQIPAGDLKTSAKVIQKVIFDHGVPPSVVKRIPELLETPVMVFKSATVDGSFVVVTSEMVRGAPLIVAISPEKVTGGGGLNFVPSLYPRDDLQSIQRWMSFTKSGEQLLTYIDKKQSPSWLGSTGLQLPGEFRTVKGLQSRNVSTQVDVVNDEGSPMFSRAGEMPEVAKGHLAKLQDKVRELTGYDSIDSFLYAWQDKFIDLKRIQANIKALNGTVSETNDAYRGEELYHKRVAKRTANFQRDELMPLMRSMNEAKVKIEEFERFLHARHAPEANRVMAERNPSQAELDAKREVADHAVKRLRLQLQSSQAKGMATTPIQKALAKAMIEADQWRGVEAFKGTEEDRMSLSGMTDAEAGGVISGYAPERRDVMDALAVRVDRINAGTMKTLEDYGLMDKATLDAWGKTYEHYVPLHRDEANPQSKAHPIGQGFSTKGDAGKRRTGSNEKVTNILGHIAMQREAALTRGEKNNVVKRLYLLASQNPDPELWSLDIPKKKAIDPETGLVKSMVDQGAKLRDNAVALRIGGKDQFILFNERNESALRLAQAIKNLDAMELDRFTRSMGKLTRWFAAVNTQYNPVFGVMNITRDVQGVMLQLSNTPLAGKQGEVMKNIRANIGTIYVDLRKERKESGEPQGEWSKLWEQLQLDGGTTGYRDLYADPADRAKALQKALDQEGEGKAMGAAHGVLNWLSDFNETLEGTTRLAVYKVALDKGLSRGHAASIAKNITVNFNRKGRNTSVVGSYYAFLNAAIQGHARMLETLTGPAGRKIMIGGVAIGMMSALAGSLIMGGGGADDEWKKIPEFTKERSIIIPLGRQDYVAIPMPLGFHVFPNIGRKMVEFAMHDDPTSSRGKYLTDMALMLANAFNPIGGGTFAQTLTPTPFDPGVALVENANWTGQQIYKEDRNKNDPTPGHSRAKDSATPVSKWIARVINSATGGNEWQQGALSPTPDALEYLFSQLTGGVGREINKLGNMATSLSTGEELAPHQMVLVGRLYGNTRGVNGQSGSYYENIKRINSSYAEAKGRADQGENVDAVLVDVPLAKAHGASGLAQKDIAELIKRRRFVQAGDDPNKREKVKAFNEEIQQRMYRLNAAVESVIEEERKR